MPSGETGYTRSGAFHLDAQGTCDCVGNAMDRLSLFPECTSVTIGSDGTVSVTTPGRRQRSRSGAFNWQSSRTPGTQQYWQQSFLPLPPPEIRLSERPEERRFGDHPAGYLEQSNVDVVEEFIQMIVAQRSYEASSRWCRRGRNVQGVNNLASNLRSSFP